jgi:hypothetical protein
VNPSDFKTYFEAKRAALDQEARSRKNSMDALFALFDLYGRFDDQERVLANEVIAEWIVSPDESLRYDATGLVREFRIMSARSALHELARRLEAQTSAGAPFELNKVRQLLEELDQN